MSAPIPPAVSSSLVSCPECDTLQRLRPLSGGQSARCRCCGAVLCRSPRGGLDSSLALLAAALILFVVANGFPFLALEAEGRIQETTLAGASLALLDKGVWGLAGVVFATSILGPGLLLIGTFYVLLAARFGIALPSARPVFRWLTYLQPWGMLDVFMLGVLVSVVKLEDVAEVILGPGLYAFVGLLVASVAATAAMEPRLVWDSLEGRS